MLRGVIPGDYRIRVTTEFDSYLKEARVSGADLLNSAAHLAGNDGSELEIQLSPNVGALDVAVLDRRDNPASGVQVVLVPDPPYRERLDRYRTGLADASGRVDIKAIDPGNYKVFAWEYLEPGSWQSRDLILRYEDLGVRVHIGEQGKKGRT